MTDMPPYLAVKDEEKNCEKGDSETSSDVDDWDLPLSFNKPRHIEPIKGSERVEHSWRVKEKYKTHCVALVLCLNVGVDPPDVVKTQPCARLECWIDPNSLSPSKALESIGHALQSQYERWQPRARYKQSLDPTSDDVKKLCCSLRRNAKDERVLFHYNGHGVPQPTVQGEIWVFNRAYTQYIPLSMYDLQTWMGAPSLYVYDCSNAGVIVDNFKQFAEQHEREYEAQAQSRPAGEEAGPPVSFRNCIQLAACAAGQSLPMNPELPADLFTACLTTPVKMAMKWFVLRSRTRVAPYDLLDLIDKIPGQVTDRRTMLGELNWIFTAITDTIAWSSLPADLFQQLFRADLLTASLCRNFLLADRIMRSYNCTPVSSPALPSLARHPLWAAWEHTLDLALAQLPALLADADPEPHHYTHSPFFRDQLTAFQVWLDLGKWSVWPAPEQLPMVLQVLLSTLHRVRALRLLCRFLSLGGWAVRAVLHVGIFPYMLKLLQASAQDLRASMVYIWAKIIAVDPSCQVDLVNAKGHKYFLSVLQDPSVDYEHRTLAAYVLAGIVDNYPAGQEAALQGSMISICLEQLQLCGAGCAGEAALLQRWLCVGVGRLWRAYDAARWAGVRDLAHEKLFPLLNHPDPEVRAAGAFALGTFVSAGQAGARSEHANALDQQVAVALAARAQRDAAPLARAELLAALQWPVLIFEQHFIAVYIQERMRRSNREGEQRLDLGQDALVPAPRGVQPLARHSSASLLATTLTLPSIGFGSVYMKLWNTLCAMSREPHPQISQMATDIINYISNQVERELEAPAGRAVSAGAGAGAAGGGASSSLPPSPNTRPSPLAQHANEHTRTLPAAGTRRGRAGLPHTISEDSVAIRNREREPNKERDSTSSNSSQAPKKPIVSTSFVEWASAQFARPEPAGAGGAAGAGEAGAAVAAGGGGDSDCESRGHHERVWRYARNRSLRRDAAALRQARVSRLETQAFHWRFPLPPAVVLFHPYDQHAAVASKDNFGIWDWGTAAKLCVGSWRAAWGRITALAYLNAHEHALLAVASHTGNLAVYRPSGSIKEPALVSAWRALDVRPAGDYRPPPAQPIQPIYSIAQLVSDQFAPAEDRAASRAAKTDVNSSSAGAGAGAAGGAGGGAAAGGVAYSPPPPPTLLCWSGARCSLALAGAAPTVRLWDAATEMLSVEIPTGTGKQALR
ncbi:LOW QUALITY PROTEIN: regulatory associated protein of MTOR complex 1 [Aphomia sociella]